MENLLPTINSMDSFQASLITLILVIAIISIPFFMERYKSRQQWADIGQIESINSDLKFRLLTIGYAIRRFERYKLFQNMYIVIVIYTAISGFFRTKNSLLAGNDFNYMDIALIFFTMLFPIVFYVHGIFLNSDIRYKYKRFKSSLNAKSLTIPVLAATNSSTIESLDSKLFNGDEN